MRVLVRADASVNIGTGHIMRCLTLAEELVNSGFDIEFVCQAVPDTLCNHISKKGFYINRLDISHNDTSIFDWKNDAQATIDVLINKGNVDLLIIDHYGIDKRWEQAVKPYVNRIMVIDDLANRQHDCDILLDQNYYHNMESRYKGLVPEQCMLLLGLSYALLRKEFFHVRNTLRVRDGNVKRLLICFGGSDPTNETAKALEAMLNVRNQDVIVDVVIGGSNPNSYYYQDNFSRLENVNLHFGTNNMAELMAQADLAIGGGGITTWERCCVGLPSLVIAIASNQVEVSQAADDLGVLKYLGQAQEVDSQTIATEMIKILNDRQLLLKLSSNALKLVDGKGTWRVAAAISNQIKGVPSSKSKRSFKETIGSNFNINDNKVGNVLVTSASRKVPLLDSLKVARAKVGENFLIYVGDTDKNCIAQYFADRFWQMPPLEKLSVDDVIDYCRKEDITMIIPTRDGELLFFAKNRDIFAKNGVSVLVSNAHSVKICLDKLLFYRELERLGYPVIKTVKDISQLSCKRFVVKDRFGAGSHSIGLNLSFEDAIKHAASLKHPIFQPFVEGKEHSVDIYISKQGVVKGVVARTRDVVVNGESQVTTTVNNPALENLAAKLATDLSLYGHVVMQVLIDENGLINIIEVNSRFGGASTLSLKAGLDSFYWFILESTGHSLEGHPFICSNKELKLIRYPKDKIITS